ncbi:hypothetical protein CKA38_01100 [Ereboglobus luteus]|uniref:Uncharacterized protein n=1 Tax=Ereboglobus luteus TaxID=1796921 RepID=A0A2U8DZL2_9BACT|nr:hypothetical protein CKA38_01100 [Ereboglobus luteus]
MCAQLGTALVNHLEDLQQIRHQALDDWLDALVAASRDYPILNTPLHILKVGIDYIKTKDQGVLLQLPQEQRKLIRNILKIRNKE